MILNRIATRHDGCLVLGCSLWLAGTLFATTAIAQGPGAMGKVWHVSVEALGQQNPQSHGDEVWVYAIQTPQETLKWKDAGQPGAKWEFHPKPNAAEGMAALAQGPAPRTMTATLRGDEVELKMIRHAWSGRVRVTVNEKSRIIDLYSPAEPQLETFTFGADSAAPPPDGAIGNSGGNRRRIFTAILGVLVFLCLAALFRSSEFRRRFLHKWLELPSRRLVIALVFGAPSSLLFSRMIFGGPEAGWAAALNFWGYLYSVGFWFGVLTLIRLCGESRPWAPPASTRPGVAYWTVAFAVSLAAATVIVVALRSSIEQKHAFWVKLTVDARVSQPPPFSIRYGKTAEAVAPVQWQPYSRTFVSIRRFAASGEPVRIWNVQSDGAPVDPEDIIAQGGIRQGDEITIAAPGGGLLRWPASARHIRFEVAGGPEPVRFYWLDQSKEVQLAAVPQEVSFDLDGTYQGWALLPPQQIESLQLTVPANLPGEFAISAAILLDGRPAQNWGKVSFGTGAAKSLAWNLALPLNRPRPLRSFLAWVSIVALMMLGLFALERFSFSVHRSRQVVSFWSKLQRPPESPSADWPVFLRFAGIILAVCCLYHLAFALCIRTGFTNDSIGYYGMARSLVEAPYLQDILITRTPGYPLFLAAILKCYGDTVLGIAIVQQLALAGLSLVTLWCLWDRLPRRWAAAAALAAGICPAVTPTANIVWTESLFCLLGFSALLFAACARRHFVYLLVAGLCVGLATMVRPNGLILLAVIGAALALQFFWQRNGRVWPQYATAVAALAGGYLLIAAPWHLHLEINRQTVELGKGLREFGTWAGYVYEGYLPPDLPINRPNRAIFAYPQAYNNDPYVLLASFPLILGNDSVNYRETAAEWTGSQPLTPYWYDLAYDCTLLDNHRYLPMPFEEVRWFLEGWKLAPEPARAQGNDPQATLTRLASATPPGPAGLSRLLIALSEAVLRHWAVLAAITALGVVIGVIAPWLIGCGFYVIATVAIFSTNLVPAERYIVVLEPLYYVLSISFAYVITAFLALRGRTTRGGRELELSLARRRGSSA